MVTEECLMDPSRNAHLSREEKEQLLKEYLGIDKVGGARARPTHTPPLAGCFARAGRR